MKRHTVFIFLAAVVLCGLVGCKQSDGSSVRRHSNATVKVQPVEVPEEGFEEIFRDIRQNHGTLSDSIRLRYLDLVDSVYQDQNYQPLWTRQQHWTPLGDSLYNFIEQAKSFGLFPLDYHYSALSFVHRISISDSLGRKNFLLWKKADILLTDAYFSIIHDLRIGRIPFDSLTLRSDTVLPNEFYWTALDSTLSQNQLQSIFLNLEPHNRDYDSIRAYLPAFLAKANFSPYTYLKYPYNDSVAFFQALHKRFQELGLEPADQVEPDTLGFRKILKKYQQDHGFRVTGRVSDPLVDKLNNTDWEKFKKIAVNLDRYKHLPDSLPATRAWVNLPEYMLRVFDKDTLVFDSKIICGGPQTRTPLLTSDITNFVTLPQWTVPFSIIIKEMLPKIKKDTNFLNRENLMVVDWNDSVLDPHKIKWSRLSKNNFPYQLKQRQGDDNSLGVIKFNFRNKYSVYMHDTNVRGKFNNSFRAISHGCVRVKEWTKLAGFLIRNDSVRMNRDTLNAWIHRQEKHVVSNFPRLPLYFRYFTCAGSEGRIKFFDDIYEEDRYLRERYFGDRPIQ